MRLTTGSITTALLAVLKTGDHVLVCDNAYRPTRLFCDGMLKRYGIDARGFRSKSWDEFIHHPIDIVITVCDNAADEVCPIFPGKQMKAHWSAPDPGHIHGAEHEIETGFDAVFRLLEQRVQALVALPEITEEKLQEIALR